MKDITAILLKGLVPALATATGFSTNVTATSSNVVTKIKKSQGYPYIHISEVFIEEDGPKNAFHYKANILIEIVYKDQTSLTTMLTTKDNVMSIINNNSPFALDSPYKIVECSLNTNTHTEVLNDIGSFDVGLVRAVFRII